MLLNELFEGSPNIEIKQLSIDSRVPMKDCIFFCITGIRYNGHDYIDEAIKNGANVIVYENNINTNRNAIFIKVNNVAKCLNAISGKFYDYPAKSIETYLIGGCEGQSSVSHIINSLLKNYKSCGSIGSLGIDYGNHHLSTSSQTLTILDNQKYLNEFRNNKIEVATFETNALSLTYNKLDCIFPDVFIYTSTNKLSKSFLEIEVNYFDAMCNYLYSLDEDVIFILNKDDISFDELNLATGKNTFTYGQDTNSDFVISDILLLKDFSTFKITYNDSSYTINTKLLGLNNVYNVTAALAALIAKGYNIDNLIYDLLNVKQVEGIIERVELENYNIYIDCASNLNDIKDVYEYAKSIKEKNSKIYTIWGINYFDEIDNIKKIAELSDNSIDHIIFTENNTYSGNINEIINETSKYFKNINMLFIEDREIAIESAIELLNSQDILLILGKGNETTITRNLGKQAYKGDKNVVIDFLNMNKENDDIY